MNAPENYQFVVELDASGSRLDSFLAGRLPQFSRTAITRAIREGTVKVNNQLRKASYKVRPDELIAATIVACEDDGPKPENIPLEIVHEDDQIVVINKPSGMVVHPAKGHWSGTLTSALAYHFQQLSQVGGSHRPGIVHRLDRDTSGVIVVAKTDQAHLDLAKQFERREVEKEYYAICRGTLDRDRDWIREPIGVHPYQREKMAIRGGHSTSREAETFFEVQQRWKGFLSLKVFPKTGRTHQIRVHLAHLRCPVLCDPLYSGQRQLTSADLSSRGRRATDDQVLLNRLALHARRIRIYHPTDRRQVEYGADVPAALQEVTQHFTP